MNRSHAFMDHNVLLNNLDRNSMILKCEGGAGNSNSWCIKPFKGNLLCKMDLENILV